MSWNLPAQWLVLHPACAEKSYCLWQGYYLGKVMVMASHCLPSYWQCLFFNRFVYAWDSAFLGKLICQETKHQHSISAKAFSCFYVLGFFCVSPQKNWLGLEVDDPGVDNPTLTPQAFCSFRWVPGYQRGGEGARKWWEAWTRPWWAELLWSLQWLRRHACAPAEGRIEWGVGRWGGPGRRAVAADLVRSSKRIRNRWFYNQFFFAKISPVTVSSAGPDPAHNVTFL